MAETNTEEYCCGDGCGCSGEGTADQSAQLRETAETVGLANSAETVESVEPAGSVESVESDEALEQSEAGEGCGCACEPAHDASVERGNDAQSAESCGCSGEANGSNTADHSAVDNRAADSQGECCCTGECGAEDAADDAPADSEESTLTPLGKAKREAAEYLEALQRERADFLNYRNRMQKEQDRFRQHGITDVLTALLPALDDIDRIREHGQMDESFSAVSVKIDKVFERFGVEKFGQKGEQFDPTRHDAILHKPDPQAHSETVDTVVEAGYRIGNRIVRAARVVVASPQE